jgi:hypothetical protein
MNVDKLKESASPLDLQTDLWWLVLLFTGLLSAVLGGIAFEGAGLFWVWFSVLFRGAIVLGLTQQPWGGIFGKLFWFGLVAGIFEIFADSLMVGWQGGARVYPGGGVLLDSPLYMPLFWACLVTEFGYAIVRIYGLVARRLTGEMGLGVAMALGGLIASISTAALEFLAVRAGWWSYQAGKSILGDSCALYVVLAQLFNFFFFLPLFARYLSCPGTRLYASLRYGIIFAGILFGSLWFSHFISERGG